MRIRKQKDALVGTRFDVDREKLVARLEQVVHGLATREIIQQASCFILTGGRVVTFNEEVLCSVKSGLPKELTGAVPAKPLLDILRRLPTDDLRIEVRKDELVMRSKRRKFGLQRDPNIVLPISEVEPPGGKWKKLAEDFFPAIGLVQECAGKDTSTVYINVHISPTYVEACSTEQMSRYTVKTPIKEDMLVRQVAVRGLPQLDLTEVQQSKTWVHFRNAKGLTVSVKRYDDKFPPLAPFLKQRGEPLQLPKTMIEALTNASVFSSENADENLVQFTMRSGEICIRGVGAHGWYEEVWKSKYGGQPLEFLVSPVVMTEIIKKHSECELTSDHKLRVRTGPFRYVACLEPPKKAPTAGEVNEEVTESQPEEPEDE